MLKRLLLLGVVSGILAGIASLIYQKVYSTSLGVDFSKIAKPVGIIISCMVGCLIAALGHWLLNKWLKNKTEIVFNFLFVILSFATIVGAFAAKLPLDTTSPELFPGMVIPMHFFPALAWLTLRPLFFNTNNQAV
jgi:uncharacterized membrane protein YeaQ/YmgE (transglycosylase-associated protein family)